MSLITLFFFLQQMDLAVETIQKKYPWPEHSQSIETILRTPIENFNNQQEWIDHINASLYEVTQDAHLRLFTQSPNKPVIFQKSHNLGFMEVQFYPFSVAYIRLDEFSTHHEAQSMLDAAMALISHSNTLILDLRFNRGGSGDLVTHFLSYYLKKPTVINTYHYRYQKKESTYKTKNLKSKVTTPKQLFVLTSPETASAAEILVNSVKVFQLGTVVGETTAGLANVADVLPLGDDLFLLFTHGVDQPPKPFTNWHNRGIDPHVTCESNLALKKALQMIYEEVATGSQKMFLETMLESLSPTKTDAQESGTYGPVQIMSSNNRVWYKKMGVPAIELTQKKSNIWQAGTGPFGFLVIFETNQLRTITWEGKEKTYPKSVSD